MSAKDLANPQQTFKKKKLMSAFIVQRTEKYRGAHITL